MSSEGQNFSTGAAREFLEDAKAQVTQPQAAPQQLDLLAVPSPEEMADAKAAMPDGNARQVLEVARGRAGRKPGSRNKATQEFKRWILSHGQHPAVTLMQIQATPPEILMENSRRKYTRIDRNGNPVEVTVEMSYAEAQGLRKQCAAELMPFIESKQPVAVDMNFSGLSDLVMEGFTHSREEIADIVNADFVEVDENGDIAEGEWEAGE